MHAYSHPAAAWQQRRVTGRARQIAVPSGGRHDTRGSDGDQF
jgi:hypothetical protein